MKCRQIQCRLIVKSGTSQQLGCRKSGDRGTRIGVLTEHKNVKGAEGFKVLVGSRRLPTLAKRSNPEQLIAGLKSFVT